MTHVSPGGTGTPALPPMHGASGSHAFTRETTVRHLDRDLVWFGIASRRQRFEELESAFVAICEDAAVRGAAHGVRIDNRDTWDRPTWQRYLAASSRLEPDFMMEMLRLLGDIEQLERLLTLPLTSAAS